MTHALRQDLIVALRAALQPYLGQFHSAEVSEFADSVQVNVEYADEARTGARLLKVLVPEEFQQVEIPNILIPVPMQHQGIGKSWIRVVQQVANRHGRRTFVSDLTQGFYRRLTARGATVIVPDDVVEILDSTRLE